MSFVQWFMSFFYTMVVCFSFSAQAADFSVPTGASVVSAPEVRKMLKSDGVLLVHTLSQIEFQMQHIPGSINIPVDELEQSSKMPVDKDTKIIFYCNGEACPYSRRAAAIAVKQGYSRVYWFKGGILGWRKYQYQMEVNKNLNSIKVKKLSPVKFREMISKDVFVLDVRPKWWRESEVQAGVIPATAMMIPLLNLHKHLALLPKDRPILLVDRVMRQTPHAAKFLKMNGFNVLGVLKGGTRRWLAEGLPILKKKDEPPMLGGM